MAAEEALQAKLDAYKAEIKATFDQAVTEAVEKKLAEQKETQTQTG